MAFTQQQLEQTANQVRHQIQTYPYTSDQTKQYLYPILQEVIDYLSGKTTQVPDVNTGNSGEVWYFRQFDALLSPVNQLEDLEHLDEQDKRIFTALQTSPVLPELIEPLLRKIADAIISTEDDTLLIKYATKLREASITDKGIIDSLANACYGTGTAYYNYFYRAPIILSNAAGKYIASLFKDYKDVIVEAFITYHNSDDWSKKLVNYLARNTDYNLTDFIYHQRGTTTYLNLANAVSIADYNAPLHESELLNAYKKGTPYVTELSLKYLILRGLANALPEKYRAEQLNEAHHYLKQINQHIQQSKGTYWGYRDACHWGFDENGKEAAHVLSAVILDDIFQHDTANARQTAVDLLTTIAIGYIEPKALSVIDKHLGKEGIDVLALGLLTDKGDGKTLKKLLELLGQYDYSQHRNKVWNLTKDKSKAIRMIATTELAKLGEAALDKCQELLNAKSADVRQTVAMILSRIKTPEAEKILLDTVNSEKNDDARDVMLEALGERRYQNITDAQLAELIAGAQKRGKLDAPLVPWLKVDDLPTIQFTEGRTLTPDEVLFLLYRMSRAKEIRTDIEARPLLLRIDRKNNGAFAKKLFTLFIDNGGDAKQKYCLTLAGLLGDDSLIDVIRTQINKWVETSRGKMAEYGVVALALIGSNKALRTVEFFSRKYKNKNGNVGAAALNALQVAAEELNMDMNELADSIIPDFGFENMYKTFKVGQDEYRAFVNKDFKLAFLNEDGKLLKSAPKGTDKELLEEFKEIGKEIRDVVKSQSGRMELYLVIQRRWQPEKWQKFFVGNPIMFVYATHLLWGIFDSDGTLIQPFYCAEDTTLLSLDDQEVMLPEDKVIGMVHPISLSEEEKTAWIQKFFDLGIETIFPQLQRPIISLKEKDKTSTEIETFAGKTGNANKVKGTFKRLGWITWELGDHGDIYSLSKLFHELGIQAIVETSGELFVGYEDSGEAEFGNLYFLKLSDKWHEEPHIPLGQVPPIVYSEVLSELEQIVPKEEVAQ
ncbi:DUF4132 domain-containing protein [Cytophagaceae bacterium DM2B3-1]|uniref:DUF4132 domain-containing protein n=1 Tax=Xanthocytophaga flava TaxID=3048013 RepID=A0ABT7CRL3_9BACT|nr:DUF4132 domain-containing protein [Xanthocytophaga flavus]MDJ1466806.1 DUF4132 domain-containing protein [Xanthocytophaga flavus]MDJ1496146.1 DUF4132 domain-containing protein [Xanthocytophaga flavus]